MRIGGKIRNPWSTLTVPNYRVRISKIEKFLKIKFSGNFLKNLENCLSRKLKVFGYSYIEARIAKPGKTLTISYYWVANFKLDGKSRNLKWKIEKKTLAIAIYDIS